MTSKFDPTKEYRDEFINVLKHNKNHFNSIINEYTIGKYNIKYYKWQHPYQGNWEYEEIFTLPILDFVTSKLKKDTVILDIGAQAGLMSVLYAQSGNKVISFEPNPATYEVLELNSQLYANIIPYNLACSNEEGPLEFHYSDEGFCNGGFATKCEMGVGVTGHVVPMDVYAVNINAFLNKFHADDIDKISLIKIDAEGHDKEIIKTLSPIIQKVKPLIITELYAGLLRDEIIDLLNSILKNNYKIYNITKNNSGIGIVENRTPIHSIADVKVGELCNLLCVPII